jgi:predicted protein tyrosine phosphatase
MSVLRPPDTPPWKVLFICSMNQWRSPTAEKILSNHPSLQVRSAGTSPKARRRVSPRDIAWADVIMVMEKKHKQRLQSDFPDAMRHKEVHILDIPDHYPCMDPELVRELQAAIEPLLSGRLRG